jgi:hypothetical protein
MVSPGFTRGYFHLLPPGERRGGIEWLRFRGEGHLTRINDILISLMEAEGRIGPGR